MPRIIAGVARGRRLVAPAGSTTRPTSDRTREGLFSALTSEFGSLDGVRFLDLYAGSGAVGLEALSRGATSVLLVEHDRRALAAIHANVAAVGVPGARVHASSVDRLLADGADLPYDIVFADPPYELAASRLDDILRQLCAGGWVDAEGVVVVERATRDPALAWPAGLAADRSRAYGEGTLWYARVEPVMLGSHPPGNDDT